MEFIKAEHIVEQLKNNLQKTDGEQDDEILKTERAVGICSAALLELREYVNHSNFKNKGEEIHFFKVTKPFVLGEYLYYSKLWEILIRQPVTSVKRRKKYLKQMISRVQDFFNDNPEFYLYYRSGSTHMDDKYFVRGGISCTLSCQHFIFDPYFSTNYDYTLAAIKANEKIAAYCNAQINRLKPRGNSLSIRTDMFWSLKKRALMQIIYGIYYTEAVNNGDIHINELVSGFESLFNVKLFGFYHTFYEIVQCKKQPFWYLDLMKETLLRRAEESDENKRRKKGTTGIKTGTGKRNENNF
ncbi:RteC domain-containing protein [Maribellus comscasis]|uniref:RteC domain-containing protein n=1 Tax=Maribellus comscasis TaxID=2681766 RepID=UPI00131E7388|nr:RteC domain-containing protein [Maribellus comscasis]